MGIADRKLTVLFLCTGNSCRSQMPKGWARQLKGGALDARSAGTASQGLDPLAVEAMSETGVDISSHRSKSVGDLDDLEFDYVITVCDAANENFPVSPKSSTSALTTGRSWQRTRNRRTLRYGIIGAFAMNRLFVEKLPQVLP